jgi:two-component system cell cycle sensor histidine kinase/response regulator CckA
MASEPRTFARVTAESAGAGVVIAGIGWFDYATGPEIAFSLFYLIPVVAAAWWMSAFTAWFSVAVATAAWLIADILFYPSTHLPISEWNAFTRLMVFGGAVAAIRKVRALRERERLESLANRKKAEEDLLRLTAQLHEAHRMEAIGRLAGGVAHDFNNLLTVILGSADYLVEQLEAAHPARHEAEEILKAGRQAAQLTRQLLAFSRRQVMEPRPIDLNAVVADTHAFLERLIGEHVRLELVPAPRPVVVNADPAQINQAIANLAANARDAMPEGGTLTLSVRAVTADGTTSALAPGSYALLSVSDTGAGMDAEVQSHLFEPFFTTKDRARGTGLGLASVHGIVEQSGGQIRVTSEVGQGTTFEIYLPTIDAPAQAIASHTSKAQLPSRKETLLLVEDEAAVRELIRRQLAGLGYTLLVAATPAEAIELAADGRLIDLLVTDVIMPVMSGPVLAEQLTARRPGLRVLYVSGYPDTALAQYGAAVPGALLLQKPFTTDALARRVRQALDRPALTLPLA